MSETELVLAANRLFYQAFNGGDPAGIEALLARRDDVTCVHPGWPALRTRQSVLESWQAILASRSPPKVTCGAEKVTLNGETAVVLCEEHVSGVTLVATNIFVLDQGEWRLLHHQATPINPNMGSRPADRPPVLH